MRSGARPATWPAPRRADVSRLARTLRRAAGAGRAAAPYLYFLPYARPPRWTHTPVCRLPDAARRRRFDDQAQSRGAPRAASATTCRTGSPPIRVAHRSDRCGRLRLTHRHAVRRHASRRAGRATPPIWPKRAPAFSRPPSPSASTAPACAWLPARSSTSACTRAAMRSPRRDRLLHRRAGMPPRPPEWRRSKTACFPARRACTWWAGTVSGGCAAS